MYRFIVFAFMIRSSVAVIYKLNETDYYKMPALFAMDDYESCMSETDGTYCIADFGIVPDSSQLYHMIKEYSDYPLKHFNHTQIHRGICVTRTCKHFRLSNNIVGLNQTLEVCLNDSLWREYKLQVKLENIEYCKRAGDKTKLDSYDVAVAIVYIIILMFNIIGSLYDISLQKKQEKSGNPYLLAFSIHRNWKKLVAPGGKSTDPRLERLRLFHGLRTMTMICVFFSHTLLIMAYGYVENPLFIEKSYEDPLKQILFNGSLVTHTFFVMSSFLLSYNFMIYAEKHSISWVDWPKGMLYRWFRLMPAYAIILATICTWMRHLGNGPMWPMLVKSEAVACRQYWWAHLLFINNYIYEDSMCAPQTWYLAADTQLFAFGLLLCVMFRTKKSRIFALAAAFLIALVIVILHTYFDDLDAVVIQSPETYRKLYANDDTFRLMYIRGHTNLSTYTMGLAGGFIAYHWQNQRKDFTHYKRHRWVIWSLVPLAVAVILSGGLFYIDGSRVSVGLRALYATIYKPLFQFMVTILIMSCIFKLENTYRGIVEWRGWTWSGRVSYSAFLLHTVFLRCLVGGQARPSYMTDYYIMMILVAIAFLSYSCACSLWLLVEAPASGLTRALLAPRAPPADSNGQGEDVDADRVRG